MFSFSTCSKSHLSIYPCHSFIAYSSNTSASLRHPPGTSYATGCADISTHTATGRAATLSSSTHTGASCTTGKFLFFSRYKTLMDLRLLLQQQQVQQVVSPQMVTPQYITAQNLRPVPPLLATTPSGQRTIITTGNYIFFFRF